MLSHRDLCKCHNTLIVTIDVGFEVVGVVFEIWGICYSWVRKEGRREPDFTQKPDYISGPVQDRIKTTTT